MAREKTPPVTVQTIAEHVGVSTAAVSTVLANRHQERRLAPATVEKIRHAIRELGYVPNVTARRLRTNDPGVRHLELGILTSFEAPLSLVSRVLREVQATVDRRSSPDRQFSVSIDIFHAGRLKQMPGLLNASRFNGVILTNTLPDDDAFLASITLPYPVVVLGRRLPNYTCVLDTPGAIGRRAAEILLKHGRSRPVLLLPVLLTQATAERAEAFAAMIREKTGLDPQRITASDFTPSGAEEAVRGFLRESPARGDAMFAVTDSLALGAYQALKRANLSIPRDVAVVGVGDSDNSAFFDPPLTCVGPAHDEIVRNVVAQLFRLMAGRGTKRTEIFVPPAVALRESA